jgi:adenylosuccinate lyase
MTNKKELAGWGDAEDTPELFKNISPFDYRYYGRSSKVRQGVEPYLSEEAYVKYLAKVEAALAQALANMGVCSQEVAKEIATSCDQVTANEIYNEEDRIYHDIRALANTIRKRVSDKAKPYVHFSATSFDIIDNARVLQFRDFCNNSLIPALLDLEKTWIELAEREKDTIQVGRTHGQHAEPITFGFTMAEYVHRLGDRIKQIKLAIDGLQGKFSGAVGAYNSSSLFFSDPLEFEKKVLAQIGLKPVLHSTQIAPPEQVLDLLHSVISCFGVIANFADDMRNLQRTEIGEIGEHFLSTQVGSSTMPQKKNPVNLENVKSFWKLTVPRIFTYYLDQISDHQRDLTNSASKRFIPEIFVGLYATVLRTTRISKKMNVDTEATQRNFNLYKDLLAAEPTYLLLAAYGHPNAHETVKQITLRARSEKKPFHKLILEDKALTEYINQFKPEQLDIILDPEKYLGIASKKTEQVCDFWKKELKI